MFRIQIPIMIVPTCEARKALGNRLRWAGLAAYREIAVAAAGLEIAHLQFAFFEFTLSVSSRVRRDRVVEIEVGRGAPRLPARTHGRPKSGRRWTAARGRNEAARRSQVARAH